MPYCPNCGSEHDEGDQFCTECGERLSTSSGESDDTQIEEKSEADTNDAPTESTDDSWNWLDPKGPFRSPRRTLNTINVLGIISFIIAIILRSMNMPLAEYLPEPIVLAIILFWLSVLVVGIPLVGILVISDNILGYLRHG